MQLIKSNSEFGKEIKLIDDNKYLKISFSGNGDLYWLINNAIINDEELQHYQFIITKENYDVYRLFDKLYSDIENINIFSFEDDYEEDRKIKYKEYNHSNYNELFDENNKTITWYSDETAHQVANYLKIKKESEEYKLDFYNQPYIEGYDKDYNYYGSISIRFSNSGSRYNPFNIMFMNMYNDLIEVEDINEYGHQIHMEEYLYTVKSLKKRRKK